MSHLPKASTPLKLPWKSEPVCYASDIFAIPKEMLCLKLHINTFYVGLYFRKTHKSSVLDGHLLSCCHGFPQHAKILQPVQLELLNSLPREGSQSSCQWVGHPLHRAIKDGSLLSLADSSVFQWKMHVIGNWMLCSDMPSHQWNPTGNGDVKINLRHIWLLSVILRNGRGLFSLKW